jgi:hypothetical protein
MRRTALVSVLGFLLLAIRSTPARSLTDIFPLPAA